MGGKITNKRGSHIKEAYDVVGDINAFYFGTNDTDPAPQSALQVPEAGRRATLGNGKNFGDFLGFLGPAQSWELCP